MFRRHSAALTALLGLTVTSLAGAQQAPDTSRDITSDQRQIAADTTRLDSAIAMQDSARATLAQDHAQTQATEARIDSLQNQLALERKATPRDTVAISRDEAALKQAKQQLDRNLDQARHEEARLDAIHKKVTTESDAAMDARQDLREDHEKQEQPKEEQPKEEQPRPAPHSEAGARSHR